MLHKHEVNPQEHNNAEARSQQSCLATLLKSHPRTDTLLKIRNTSAGHPPVREHLCGLLLHVKRNLKDLSFYLQLLKEIY